MCLKETKKSHKTDRVDNGLAKIMTTAMKISSKIIKGLLQSPGQGKTVFLNSVENQVTKKTKSIYSEITKQKITRHWSEEIYQTTCRNICSERRCSKLRVACRKNYNYKLD